MPITERIFKGHYRGAWRRNRPPVDGEKSRVLFFLHRCTVGVMTNTKFEAPDSMGGPLTFTGDMVCPDCGCVRPFRMRWPNWILTLNPGSRRQRPEVKK